MWQLAYYNRYTDGYRNSWEAAKKYGTLVSFDLNHRATFWKGREEELHAAFHKIASVADILVGNEEDLYMGLELIDIAMKSKGFTDKPGDPEIKPITAEERELGFLFSFKNDKVADTLKEWFELLRLEAKSFVLMGDSGTPRDLNGKYIVTAKRY